MLTISLTPICALLDIILYYIYRYIRVIPHICAWILNQYTDLDWSTLEIVGMVLSLLYSSRFFFLVFFQPEASTFRKQKPWSERWSPFNTFHFKKIALLFWLRATGSVWWVWFWPCFSLQHLEFRRKMKVDSLVSDWRPPEVKPKSGILFIDVLE